MAIEELEEVIEYEGYADYFEDATEKDKSGQVRFKSVNYHKRAEANKVESDGEIATYANYALEYFGYRCALSGEKFIIFDNEVERKNDKRITINLSAEHVVALSIGGNDIIPNIVPSVLQYNMQKNGYYILDWWPKVKDVNGNPIYTPEKLLKIVNYMLKSLQARKDLGIKKQPRQYRKRLLTPNEIDEFLMQEGIAEGLISETITAATEVEDGKSILTQIPQQEGRIPSLAKQKDKETKITEAMFLADAIEVLGKEEIIPQEIISELQNMYKEVEGEIPFEIEVRRNILSVLEEMGIKNNKYTAANDLLVNSDILKEIRKFDGNGEIQNIIQNYIDNKVEELKEIISEEQVILAISNMPDCIYNDVVRNRIKFWKDNRLGSLNEILQRGENKTDNFIDIIIKMKKMGIDISKLSIMDTIESLAKKSGITNEQLEEVGLNPTDNIGYRRENVASDYRKKQKGKKTKGIPATDQQAEELLRLGISLELQEKINQTQKFIEAIKELKRIGVDISKLKEMDTIENLAKKSGVAKKQLEEAGLNPIDQIGRRRGSIVKLYRKKQRGEKTKGTPPTEEQIEELLRLGIPLESNNPTERFIETIKKLKRIGVDISKLIKRDTIESLAQKSGITNEQLEEVGLNPTDNIGYRRENIAATYRKQKQGQKTKGKPPTAEQIEELFKLGILLEIQDKINPTEELIKQIKILQGIGVDTSKLTIIDTIESLAQKSGITNEQLEEVGLNPTDKIGNRKNTVAGYYRKTQQEEKAGGTPPTEEQIEELLRLGISLELHEKINQTQKFIETIKKLKGIGIGTSKLIAIDTIENLAQKSRVTKKQLEEAGLNPTDKIGKRRENIAASYRKQKQGLKTKGIPPTEEQIEELFKLGITLERKNIKDVIKQNRDNLSEAMQVGEELEAEILMVEKVSERSASDGREQ